MNLPQHIAVVMDGNGRWAAGQGLPRVEGHKAGVKAVKRLIKSCLEKDIPNLSLFAFSSENWSRPVDEVNFLMQLFLQALADEVSELAEHGVRLKFSGDRSPLAADLQTEMAVAEQRTQSNQQLTLNIMVNYGGKWDILQATRAIVRAVQAGEITLDTINEELFAQYLDTADLPAPDLFIRTSGELRLSNFYLWQLAYTELYFTEVLWPDFDETEFAKALTAFSQRQRRFGGILMDSLQG